MDKFCQVAQKDTSRGSQPFTRLLPSSPKPPGLAKYSVSGFYVLHIIIAVALSVLYFEALFQRLLVADLLCYNTTTIGGTANTTPCNLHDETLSTVYELSIWKIVSECWSSRDYHIALALLCLSILFPIMHILNNLHAEFHRSRFSKCSVITEYLHKLSAFYIFASILLIHGLFQHTETPSIVVPPVPSSTMHQLIVIKPDIAVNVLILALYLSSIWTLYVECPEFRCKWTHRRMESVKPPILQREFGGILVVICAVTFCVFYLMDSDMIHFQYHDDWGLYNTMMDAKEREFGVMSLIQTLESHTKSVDITMISVFYWIYVIVLPITCCCGYVAVYLVLLSDRKQGFQAEVWRVLWWINASCNGLDVLIISMIVVSLVLPSLWDMIIADIYGDFCAELSLFGDSRFCDTLKLEVTLKGGIWIAGVMVLGIWIFHWSMTVDKICLKPRHRDQKSMSFSACDSVEDDLGFVALSETLNCTTVNLLKD